MDQHEEAKAKPLSELAQSLISAFQHEEAARPGGRITVNPLVSKVATWYEQFRNIMEYREDEVILRAAIERILKRRLLLGGNGKKVGEPLVRELVWAHYFPDNTVAESLVEPVEERIDVFLRLRELILKQHKLPEGTVTEWMYHLMSSSIEYLLNPKIEKQLIANFMFHIVRNQVVISDENEQNRDAQVFMSVRRAFAKDDIAFLRYHLLTQLYGEVTPDNVEDIAKNFTKAVEEIKKQFEYPRKDRIFTYVKNRTAIFFILEDLLRLGKENVNSILKNEEELTKAIFAACEVRYNSIRAKVNRAIIRSVLFILASKAIFAFAIEGTFESILYGKVHWGSILLNTSMPPLLMIITSLFIKTPERDNSERIVSYIQSLLYAENPHVGAQLIIKKKSDKRDPVMQFIFYTLWILAYFVSFGLTIYVLNRLNFNFLSQGIFLFFLAIVSFLTYRINLLSKTYTVEEKQGWLTPLVDFFFMPIVRIGRDLTEGIAQINILIFLFDFVIETPFKGIFGFFEQWFFYLHSKRENLG